ncbi:hypothetical protein [Fimbriiglobus ruber]|uniref:Phage-related protein n=1 Tax=Fimbriiglobus ruber TaxID=1908690 RepID=A0A225E273_9BACT|nr:hypothetical protein [Fimbriiglobus ruber]OWK42477.1 Phage-related protein [Fimbriiglobus ruber]
MTGDTGWIKANDRDISLFKQTTAASSPNTARLHDFADAMFFPDTLLNGVTIARTRPTRCSRTSPGR